MPIAQIEFFALASATNSVKIIISAYNKVGSQTDYDDGVTSSRSYDCDERLNGPCSPMRQTGTEAVSHGGRRKFPAGWR